MERKSAVSGVFYPKRCADIKRAIEKFNNILSKHFHDKNLLRYKPSAIVVPHAGYIYSGYTANIAYKIASNTKPKRVVVVGPSHKFYFKGISGADYDDFQTPCGNIKIDKEYLEKIKKYFPVASLAKAHQKEHSTEVQMPFIKYYFPHSMVVEIVYGKVDYYELSKLLYAILNDKENLLVISTDLSHFYPLKVAKQKDNICLNAIVKREPSILDRGCEACGFTGLKALLEVVKKRSLKTKLLDYRTSADASGDTKSVVGYVSAMIFNQNYAIEHFL